MLVPGLSGRAPEKCEFPNEKMNGKMNLKIFLTKTQQKRENIHINSNRHVLQSKFAWRGFHLISPTWSDFP